MPTYIYGIDFGTTNSALAILNVANNQIEKIFTAPSVLFFPAMQTNYETVDYEVGNKAVEQYVASQMKGRFMKSIKRILPNKSFTYTRIASKMLKAEELVCMIIAFLKKQADEYLEQEITTAVIGRPVIFDEQQEKDEIAQQRLAKAVEQAGFTEYYFQMEPVAAAFAYERNLQKEELVLVGDFGGGTSDFTLMRLNPDHINKANRKMDMLSKGGIYIGGDNFDSNIMWHKITPYFGRGVKEKFALDNWLELPNTYFNHICSWEQMNFLNTVKMREAIKKSYIFSGYNAKVKNLLALIENNLGYTLFKEIEQSKINLSDRQQSGFAFHQNEIDIETNITLAEFENEIIVNEVKRIEDYLDQYLQNNSVSYNHVDTVFLTGGSSMVQAIQLMFHKKFGKEKIKSGDNFNSVAVGLAYAYNVVKE